LKSIVRPRNVTFIDGSAFSSPEDFSLSIERGDCAFAVEGDFLLDISRTTLIGYLGSQSSIVIPRNVEIIGSKCFGKTQSVSSISFESNSQLRQIESLAFSSSSLRSIIIPRNVPFIDAAAFSNFDGFSLSIESGNTTFAVEGDFLFDISKSTIVRYFGSY
jgi:hypothetical protein